MSYHGQALLAQDLEFRHRVTACVGTQFTNMPPQSWTDQHIWQVAAAPGFGDAYTYALETNVENPGADPAVISDEQILAAVQAVIQGTL